MNERKDANRFNEFSIEHDNITLDYTRQRITPEIKVRKRVAH